MTYSKLEIIFFETEKIYIEKFDEHPCFSGYIRYSQENLDAMDRAIRTNKPLKFKDLPEGKDKRIFT